MIKLNNVSHSYGNFNALKNINLQIDKGSKISIIGLNGSGKTTLIRCIANLIKFDGEITYNNEDITKIKIKHLASKIAVMNQFRQVYFPYTVYELVAFARYSKKSKIFHKLTIEDNEIIIDCIEKVGLKDQKDKLITDLSGGQVQKAFLAKAFAQDTDVLILDEPTNHLDLKSQYDFINIVNSWSKEKTIISILHDINLTSEIAEDVVLMHNGEIKKYGKVKDILNSYEINEVFQMNIKENMNRLFNQWSF